MKSATIGSLIKKLTRSILNTSWDVRINRLKFSSTGVTFSLSYLVNPISIRIPLCNVTVSRKIRTATICERILSELILNK